MTTADRPRLLSPMRRRIVDVIDIGQAAAEQLRKLGWSDYDGPGQATRGLDEHATREVFADLGYKGDDLETLTGEEYPGTRNGWVVIGSDCNVDLARLERTRVATLGTGRVS